ncbi:MAG: hypothetical protein PHN82_09060 [bacterium]|nr:hypothetical protein [bacterium]
MKLAVLIHEKDRFERSKYFLTLLVDAWRREGIEVTLLRGAGRFEPADAVFLHVDQTVVPREYLSLCRRYPIAINGRVADISKRRVSSRLVGFHDPYDGEVIVKTDRNFGGTQERRRQGSGPARRFRERLRGALPWSLSGHLTPDDYPIYPSRRDVPLAVWLNPSLVVERFIPEREGKYYALRQWVFLGDRETSGRVLSAERIVKSTNVAHREYDLPIPDAIRAERRRLGFDYGKFDYVLHDGEAVLLDANATHTFNRQNPSRRLLESVGVLSKGLHALLAAPGEP